MTTLTVAADTFDDEVVWEVIVTVYNDDDDVTDPEPQPDLDANINQNTIFPTHFR